MGGEGICEGDGQGVLGPGIRVVSVRGVCRATGGDMGARGRDWGRCAAVTNGFAFGDSGAVRCLIGKNVRAAALPPCEGLPRWWWGRGGLVRVSVVGVRRAPGHRHHCPSSDRLQMSQSPTQVPGGRPCQPSGSRPASPCWLGCLVVADCLNFHAVYP